MWSFCFKWQYCGKLTRLSGQPRSILLMWAAIKWEWFLFVIQNGFSLVIWWKDILYSITSPLNHSITQCVFSVLHLHYTSPVFLISAFFAWFRGPLESCMWAFALSWSRSQRLWTADTSFQTGRWDGGTMCDSGTEVVVVQWCVITLAQTKLFGKMLYLEKDRDTGFKHYANSVFNVCIYVFFPFFWDLNNSCLLIILFRKKIFDFCI